MQTPFLFRRGETCKNILFSWDSNYHHKFTIRKFVTFFLPTWQDLQTISKPSVFKAEWQYQRQFRKIKHELTNAIMVWWLLYDTTNTSEVYKRVDFLPRTRIASLRIFNKNRFSNNLWNPETETISRFQWLARRMNPITIPAMLASWERTGCLLRALCRSFLPFESRILMAHGRTGHHETCYDDAHNTGGWGRWFLGSSALATILF